MANMNGNGNYAKNQNIYNNEAVAKKMSSDDPNPLVRDTSDPALDYIWADSVNGKVKEHMINGLITARYNKSYGYWISNKGTLYYREDGKWQIQQPKTIAASDMNGYKRANERYYQTAPSRHPDFKGKEILVHHIVSYVWITEGSLRYQKNGVVIDHIDGNSLNNTPSNLQYLSFGDNIAKFQSTGK